MPPPFTYRELKTIQEGHRRNADVLDLLREIRRLRLLVAEVYLAIKNIPLDQFPIETGQLIAMFDALRAEPSVQERMRVEHRKAEMEMRRRNMHASEATDLTGEG